jgi:methylase of polypeptide subunit release factors
MLEHGYDQAASVQQLLDDAGFIEVAATRDLAGILRVTYACVAGSSLPV